MSHLALRMFIAFLPLPSISVLFALSLPPLGLPGRELGERGKVRGIEAGVNVFLI